MKNAIKVTLISAVGALSAGAATTITPTNFGGVATRQIQSVLGVPLPATTSYEVGVFSGNIVTVSTTLADFTPAGSALLSTSQLGIFGNFGSPGVVVDLPNAGDPAGNFVGRPMFVVIREPGATGNFIAFSTPAAANFAFENTLNAGTPVNVTNASLTLVQGTLFGTNKGLTGAAASGNGGTAITFIPEPSAALLGALGVLGLLRRRRI